MNKYKIEYAIFSKIAKVKKCRSCFRCNQRDNDYRGGWWDISKKPKENKDIYCCSACSPDIDDWNTKACESYEPRWYWNARQLYGKYRYLARRWYEEHIRTKIGALRPPVELEWVASYDGMRDEIIPNGEPRCPYCGEMPYSVESCVFCGQRFIQKIKPRSRNDNRAEN